MADPITVPLGLEAADTQLGGMTMEERALYQRHLGSINKGEPGVSDAGRLQPYLDRETEAAAAKTARQLEPPRLPDDARPETNLGLEPGKPSPFGPGAGSVVRNQMPRLLDIATKARAQGYSWQDISDGINAAWQAARNEGRTDVEIQTYYGFKDPKPFDTRYRNHLKSALNQEKPPAVASNPFQSFLAGTQDSALGLGIRQSLPDLIPGQTFLDHTAAVLGQTVADLPYMVVGATMGFFAGAAAGLPTGPGAIGTAAAGGAAGLALPTFIRSTYWDAYEKGAFQGPEDAAYRIAGIVFDTAKAAVMGAAAGGVGAKAAALSPWAAAGPTTSTLISSNAAFLATQAAIEMRLPSYRDLADAAITTMAMHGVSKAFGYAPQVATNFGKYWAATGEPPAVAAMKARSDPKLYNDLMTPQPDTPPAGSATHTTPEGTYVLPRARGAFDEVAPAVLGTSGKGVRYGISEKLVPGVDLDALTPDAALSLLHEHGWKRLELDDAPKEWHAPALEAAARFGPEKVIEWLDEARGDLGKFKALATEALTPKERAEVSEPSFLATKTETQKLLEAPKTQAEGGGGGGKPPVPPDPPNWTAAQPPRPERRALPPPEIDPVTGQEIQSLEGARAGIERSVVRMEKPWTEAWYLKLEREMLGPENPLNRLYRSWSRGDPIPDADNFMFMRRLEETTSGRVRYQIEKKQTGAVPVDASGPAPIIGPGLREIVRNAGADKHANDFVNYTIAKRSLAERANGVKTPISELDARTFIEHMDAQHGDKFAVATQQLMDYRTNLIRYMLDREFINQQQFDIWTQEAKYGIPGWRDFGGAEQARRPGTRTFNPIFKVEGSDTAPYLHPFDVLVRETMLRTQLADRNASALSMTRQALKVGAARIVNEIKPKPRDIEGVTTLQETGRTNVPGPDSPAPFRPGEITDLVEMVEFGMSPTDAINKLIDVPLKDNQLAVFDRGRRLVVEFDDAIVPHVLRDYDPYIRSVILDTTAKMTFPIRWFIVKGNPVFPATIYGMDTFTQMLRPSGVFGKNSAPANAVLGLFQSLARDKLGGEAWDRAVRTGVIPEVFERMSNDKTVDSILRDRDNVWGRMEWAWNITKSPLEWLVSSLYSANAVGGYSRALGREGATGIRAVVEGQESTQQRSGYGGSWGHAANRIVPFTLAFLNGMEQTLRRGLTTGESITGEKYSPFVFNTVALASITVPALMQWNSLRNDPDWRAASDWEKYNYFWGPKMGGRIDKATFEDSLKKAMANGVMDMRTANQLLKDFDGQVGPRLKLRLPPLVAQVYRELPIRMAEAMYADNPRAWDGVWNSFFRALAPPGADALSPMLLQPVIEAMVNHSFLTGRPIVPEYMQKNLLTPDRAYPYTSQLAQGISNMIGNTAVLMGGRSDDTISPIKVDHLIRGWSGSAGASIIQVTEKALGMAGALELKDQPAREWFETPFFRSLLTRRPGISAEPTITFIERMQHMSQVHGSLVKAMQDGNLDRFKEILAENKQSALMHKWALSKSQLMLMPSDPIAMRPFIAELQSIRGDVDFQAASRIVDANKSLENMRKMTRMIYANNRGSAAFTPNDQRMLLDQLYLQMMLVAERGHKDMNAVGMQ